jgi:hypothetical protein
MACWTKFSLAICAFYDISISYQKIFSSALKHAKVALVSGIVHQPFWAQNCYLVKLNWVPYYDAFIG